MLLVGLEPEDEAGTIFLRLRKASRSGTTVASVAPFASRGLEKMAGTLIPTAPGAEAAALGDLPDAVTLDGSSVILVGERLATSPGALTAAAELAERTGAALAWVPRRAGDRGAIEAGCLPTLLPGGRPVADASARVDVASAWGVEHLPSTPGRDADQIVAALLDGSLGGLVIGGVDPADTADPAATMAAVDAAGFVVALELRETAVTRAADVVFPVATAAQKAGTFVNWEGRPRPFETAIDSPAALPDLRVLAGIAEEAGVSLGFRTVAEVRAEMAQLGPWDGPRSEPSAGSGATNTMTSDGGLLLATWKQMIDKGTMLDGADHLRATARRPVARLSAVDHEALGAPAAVRVTGDRGSLTLPAAVTDMVAGVVWVPSNSAAGSVLTDLGTAGSLVTVAAVPLPEGVQ